MCFGPSVLAVLYLVSRMTHKRMPVSAEMIPEHIVPQLNQKEHCSDQIVFGTLDDSFSVVRSDSF